MSGEYTIEPVKEGDAKGVMDFLKKTFFIDEPLNAAVGLCANNAPCPELEAYCAESLMEGLSYKAVDNQGNIVAVMISGVCLLKEDENGNDLLSQAKRCKNPKFQKILHILASRESGSRLWEKFPEDKKLVEVKVAATDPSWRRKGIMNKLLKETEKATISRGLRLLRMDCSSRYSALSAERLGFTFAYSRQYIDIQLLGKPLVVPPPPHTHDTVYVKQLTSQNTNP